LLPPSAEHWFGTDDAGRDVFDRVLVGTRISFFVGFSVTLLSSVIGTLVGLIAGYNRLLDNIIMRFVDAMLAFPTILLALALIALWGPGLPNVILALTVTGTASKVRLVRGQVLSLRESTYVEASRVAGASTVRILLTHVMPNTLGIVIVLATFTLASSILAEAGLSFLGAGVPSHIPSWGNIIANGQRHVQVSFWVSFFPGIFLTLTVLAVVLIGDALRDHLDPKLRGRLESSQISTGKTE
jgi:peptide/nickel transport system permease protein